MPIKDEILQLWLDWVEYMNHPMIETEQGDRYCYFCDGGYSIVYGGIKHKKECIYILTYEYIESLEENE